MGWRLVLLLGLTSSIRPQQDWLSRDKSHRHLKSIALSGSKSIQPQLVNALDKRQALANEAKRLGHPTESSFQIITDLSLCGTSTRLPFRLSMINKRASKSLAMTGVWGARAQVKRRPSVQIR